ncbi:hypothetical protein BH20ACT9_BH20ACT9_09870 [soil metagenome]
MRRLWIVGLIVMAMLAVAGPASACAGLLSADGGIPLLRTTTLAAYAGGVEHYVTSFQYAGGGAEFGSIVPLPGVPTKVRRGGAWTLERLLLETQSQQDGLVALSTADQAARSEAQVLQEVRIGALDLTVLRGGGRAVGDWARRHGFSLPPDAPEVLDFYADRSPIFLAARYDPETAAARGTSIGEGTPVHLTIPTGDPWVPLRILGLGAAPSDRIDADVFLLTERRPALLPVPAPGLSLQTSQRASAELLTDLRGDRGMGWLPEDMWLSHLRVGARARELDYDLAVDASGTGMPSATAAGLALLAQPARGRR